MKDHVNSPAECSRRQRENEMGRLLTQQPNGLYALFSTIVDDFVLVNATLEEVIEEEVAFVRRQVERDVPASVKRHGTKGLRKRFDKYAAHAREVHGGDPEGAQMAMADH